MKLHFTPVGNAAPPRPRSPEALTSSMIFSRGVCSRRIFSHAWYPPNTVALERPGLAEQAVDLDTGAIVAITTQGGAVGDTNRCRRPCRRPDLRWPNRSPRPPRKAQYKVHEQGHARSGHGQGLSQRREFGGDERECVRSYVSVPQQPRRNWKGKAEQQAAVYANRRRVEGERGKRLLRRRGEFLERPFAHQYETGAMRRVHVRGRGNVAKRVLLQAAAFNLALILRSITKAGTPKGLADLKRKFVLALLRVLAALSALCAPLTAHGRFSPTIPYRQRICGHLRQNSPHQKLRVLTRLRNRYLNSRECPNESMVRRAKCHCYAFRPAPLDEISRRAKNKRAEALPSSRSAASPVHRW